MIFGDINRLEPIERFLRGPVWKKTFEALNSLTPDSSNGIRYFESDKFFVNVHGYETLPVEECRFEGHQQTIDVQYTISGGELIHWAPKWELQEDGDYQASNDFQYFRDPPDHVFTQTKMSPGNFVVFFPNDGHRPKIHDGEHSRIHKAVVKIDMSLMDE